MHRSRALLHLVAIASLVLVGANCGAVRQAREAGETVGDIKETADNLEKGTTGDKKLDAFLKKAEAAQKATFTAEYESTPENGDGDETTYRIVQQPPQGRIDTITGDGKSGTIHIDDGTDTHNCVLFEGEPNCSTDKGSGGNAEGLAALSAGFSPLLFLASLKAFVPLLGDSVEIKHSTETRDGTDLACVELAVKDPGDEDKQLTVSRYCINDDGVIAFVKDSGRITTLVEYDPDVDEDEFVVPAGAGDLNDPSSFTPSTRRDSPTTTTTGRSTDTTTYEY